VQGKLNKFITTVLIVVVLPLAIVWLVNQRWVLTHVLRTVNLGSETQIALAEFSWNPLTSRIKARGLGIHHERTGRDGWVESINIRYRPLGLLRGKFIVRELNIAGVNVILPPGEKKKKEHKRINIGRLLLLHSLIVERALIDNLAVSFGKDSTFRSDKLLWSLVPRITGDTTLVLSGEGISLHRAVKPLVLSKTLMLKTSTRLSRWYVDFPYLNAMRGAIIAKGLELQTLPIDSLNARMSYNDGTIKLRQLKLNIGGNNLIGELAADINTQKFNLDIDIPKPLALPYIGKEIKTLVTAGNLSGRIKLEGEGLIVKESKGKGSVNLSYQFDQAPDWPLKVETSFNWGEGKMAIREGHATVPDTSFTFDGDLNFIKKSMNFTAEGKRFPLGAIFEIFRNPHLQKIYGQTDFEGQIEGWGKKFVAKVNGTTFDGGFKPMVGQRIETEFTATYDKLDFAWKVFQEDKHTGTADLVIAMGPKMPGVERRKTIDLKANINGHQLEPTFPGFNLTGLAKGEIVLKGPHKNFDGTVKVTVTKGGWLNVPLERVSTDIALTRPKLTFTNIELTPATLKKISCPNPLVMDLPAGRLRLHGTPIDGLTMALTYTYNTKTTNIEKMDYVPPERPGEHVEIKGRIVSGGSLDLTGTGEFDLTLIEPLGVLIREASGPVVAKLRATGTSASPALTGTITLNNNILYPRAVKLAMEDLKGLLRFEGHRIHFDGISGLVQDGEFTLDGWVDHREYKLSSANLKLKGKELSFRTAGDTFRMEFDGDLTLKGDFPHPLLSGDVNILDGRYTKDFTLLEQISGGRAKLLKEDGATPTFDPRLNLAIHNTGDLLIRNNVGNIDLQANVKVTGLRSKPIIAGVINTREGSVDYMGLGFDINRGFIEFRDPYTRPYLEIQAQRELRLYNLNLRLYGRIDNLALDLEGSSPTGSLEKRDIISLLTSGVTERERRESDFDGRERQLGVSVAAQQVGGLLERPISELTHLDIFRIEAAEPEDTDEPGKVATRLRVGKQLTDRLSVDFSTDIDTKDAEQTITTEYLVTDNVIIKGSRGSDSHYRGRVGLRFRLR
jgi:hypothetical protein